jgi:hypothetical protein
LSSDEWQREVENYYYHFLQETSESMEVAEKKKRQDQIKGKVLLILLPLTALSQFMLCIHNSP